MNTIKLTKRLQSIVKHVSPGSRVIDVGTDHGQIPVFLEQTGGAVRITASDIKAGPLESARETAQRYGCKKIEFICAPGLQGAPADTDTVIIAGMGGETIAGILRDAADLLVKGIRLILQPQSKLEFMCGSLRDIGYSLTDAELVCCTGRIYVIVTAEKKAERQSCDVLRLLYDKKDLLFFEYLEMQIRRTEVAVCGLERANGRDGSAEVFRERLNLLRNYAKETEIW